MDFLFMLPVETSNSQSYADQIQSLETPKDPTSTPPPPPTLTYAEQIQALADPSTPPDHPIPNPRMDDGDSGIGSDGTRFRANGMNTPEVKHGISSYRVDDNPDGYIAAAAVKQLEAEGATFSTSGGRGAKGRQLADFKDAQGRDLSQLMIKSGLAYASRGESSAAAEEAGIIGRMLGDNKTGNEAIDAYASQLSGQYFDPLEGGIVFDPKSYSREGAFMSAFRRGTDETKASLGGALNYAGDLLGIDEWVTSGKQMAKRGMLNSEFNPRRIRSIKNIDSFDKGFKYIAETLGELAPGLILDATVAAVTMGAGGLALASARRVGLAALRVSAEKGMLTGFGLSGFTKSLGLMENRLEAGGSEVNTYASLASGIVGAAVNTVPIGVVFPKLARAAGVGDKAITGVLNRLKDVSSTIKHGAVAGGAMAMAQQLTDSIIDYKALDKGEWDLNTVDFVDNTIRAIIGGGVSAAGGSVAAHSGQKIRSEYTLAKRLSALKAYGAGKSGWKFSKAKASAERNTVDSSTPGLAVGDVVSDPPSYSNSEATGFSSEISTRDIKELDAQEFSAVDTLVRRPDGSVKSWGEITHQEEDGVIAGPNDPVRGIIGGVIEFGGGKRLVITEDVLAQYAASKFVGKDGPVFSKQLDPETRYQSESFHRINVLEELRLNIMNDNLGESPILSAKHLTYLLKQDSFLVDLNDIIGGRKYDGGEAPLDEFLAKYYLQRVYTIANRRAFVPDGRKMWVSKFDRKEATPSPVSRPGGQEIDTTFASGFRPPSSETSGSQNNNGTLSLKSRRRKAEQSRDNADLADTSTTRLKIARLPLLDKAKILASLAYGKISGARTLAHRSLARLALSSVKNVRRLQRELAASELGSVRGAKEKEFVSYATRLNAPEPSTITPDQLVDHIVNHALNKVHISDKEGIAASDAQVAKPTPSEVVHESVISAVKSGDKARVQKIMETHDLDEADVRSIVSGRVAESPSEGSSFFDVLDPNNLGFADSTYGDDTLHTEDGVPLSLTNNFDDNGSITTRQEIGANRNRRKTVAGKVIDFLESTSILGGVDLSGLRRLVVEDSDTSIETSLNLKDSDAPLHEGSLPFHIETQGSGPSPQTSGKGGRVAKTIRLSASFLKQIRSLVKDGDLEGARTLLTRKQLIGGDAHLGDSPVANDAVRVLALLSRAYDSLAHLEASDQAEAASRGYLKVEVTFPSGKSGFRFIRAHDITEFGAAQIPGVDLHYAGGSSWSSFTSDISRSFSAGLSRLIDASDESFSFGINLDSLPSDAIVYSTGDGLGYSLKSVIESQAYSEAYNRVYSDSPLNKSETRTLKTHYDSLEHSLKVNSRSDPGVSEIAHIQKQIDSIIKKNGLGKQTSPDGQINGSYSGTLRTLRGKLTLVKARSRKIRASRSRRRQRILRELRVLKQTHANGEFSSIRRFLNSTDNELADMAVYESLHEFNDWERPTENDRNMGSAVSAAEDLRTPRSLLRGSKAETDGRAHLRVEPSPWLIAKLLNDERLAALEGLRRKRASELSEEDRSHNIKTLKFISRIRSEINRISKLLYSTAKPDPMSSSLVEVFLHSPAERSRMESEIARLKEVQKKVVRSLRVSTTKIPDSPGRGSPVGSKSSHDNGINGAIKRIDAQLASKRSQLEEAANTKLSSKERRVLVSEIELLRSERDAAVESLGSFPPRLGPNHAGDYAPTTVGGHDLEIPEGQTLTKSEGREANTLLLEASKPNIVFRVISKLFDSTRTRIERFNYTLAEALMTRSGEGNLDGSFERDSRLMYENRLVKLDALFDVAEHRKGEVLQAAFEDAQGGEPTTYNGKKLLVFVNEFHQDLGTHNPLYDSEGLPVTLDVAAIDNNRMGFLEILRKNGVEDTTSALELVTNSDGVVAHYIDLAGVRNPVGVRKFNTQLRKSLEDLRKAGMVDSDGATSIDRFLASGAKFAEWSRIFGLTDPDGVYHQSGFYDYLIQKTAPENLGEVRGMVNTILGRSPPVPSWVNRLNSTTFAFQAATVLLFSGTSSLPELSSIIGRSRGDIHNMASELKNLIPGRGFDKLNALSKAYETASISVNRHSLGNLFGAGDKTIGKFSRSVSEAVFKINGQNYITHYTRGFATSMGRSYIMDHIDAALMQGDRVSIDALQELGLSTSDIASIKRAEFVSGLDNIDLSRDGGLLLKQAVARFVDESVSNPHKSQMPRWMSDPRYQIIASLKKFMYAMWDNSHRQGYSAYKKGIAQGRGHARAALPLALMVATALPLAAVAELLRELIKYPLGRPKWRKRDMYDWMLSVSNATGYLGPLQAAQAAYEQQGYGRNFLVSAAGPTVSLVVDTARGRTSPNRFVPFASQVPWAGKPLNKKIKDLYKWVSYGD